VILRVPQRVLGEEGEVAEDLDELEFELPRSVDQGQEVTVELRLAPDELHPAAP
jgi:hypothetical protein